MKVRQVFADHNRGRILGPIDLFGQRLCQSVEDSLGEQCQLADVVKHIGSQQAVVDLLLNTDNGNWVKLGAQIKEYSEEYYQTLVASPMAVLTTFMKWR